MHLEKYDRGAVTRMFAHYDRSHPGSKSNIDTAKSILNYNAAAEDQPLAQHDYLDKRLSQVKVQNRKDVNVMCDWVITAPQTLEDHEYDMFFRETYKFMSGRYGAENVISAYVHMDETQPHMHFSFIPVTMDKKKHRPKVCAKELLNKQELRTIHDDINSYMTEVFGRDIGMRNGATALGNVTIDTLRKNKAKAAKIQDTVISEKTAELERVRNSAAGKIFKKDTVTMNGAELEHLKEVMQESTVIVDKVDTILQQAEDQRQKAQHERIIAENIRQQVEEYTRDEQKKAESKTTELEEWSHLLYDREHCIDLKEQHAEEKMRIVYEQIRSVSDRELAVINRAQELDERQRDIEYQEKEMKHRNDDPYGYYNAEIQKLQSVIDAGAKDCAVKENTIEQQSARIISLEEENERMRKKSLQQLRQKEQEKQAAVEQAISDTTMKFIGEITKKDELINSMRATIESLREKLKHAYLVVRNICNAVVALAYNIDGDSTYKARLEPIHKKLIDGVCNYAAKEAEAENFREEAKSIRDQGGIDDKIQLEMDRLNYHVVKKEQTQSYEMEL